MKRLLSMLGRLLLLLSLCAFWSCSTHRLDPDRLVVYETPVQKVVSVDSDLDAIVKHGLLKVGIKKHAPPFSELNSDGKYVGFDIEIAKALASFLEVPLELVPIESKDRIPFLQNGSVDVVVATMTITRLREEEVDFSIPYFQDGQALLGLKATELDGYRGLKGKKVGVVEGTTSQSNMNQVQPNCEVVPYKSADVALSDLLEGKIAAFTSDAMMLVGLTLEGKYKDQLEIKGDKFTVEPYGVALRQNQSKLRDAVNEAIMDFWKTGSWSHRFERYFGKDTPYHSKNYFSIDVIE